MNFPWVHSVEEGEVWSPRQGLFLVRSGGRLEGASLVFHFTGWKVRPMRVDYGARTRPARTQYWVRLSLRLYPNREWTRQPWKRLSFYRGTSAVEL